MSAFYEDRVNDLKLWWRDTLSFLPHFHDSFEIVLVLNGTVNTIIDGTKYSLSKGDIAVAFPNSIHSYDTENDLEAYLFIVPRRYAEAFSKDLESLYAETPVFKSNDKIVALLNNIIDANKINHPYKNQMLQGYFSILFAELFNNIKLVKCNKTVPETDRNIITYCVNNFRHDISLDLLSRELHISKNHISYIFSSKLKTSLPDFIGELRIEEAKRLIQSGASMTDAALNSGFSSIRTFNRRFIAKTGLTPREFAKAKGAI